MRQKIGSQTSAAEKTIKDIRRATRKHHSSEDKIRLVLEGLRGEESIAAICRREGIAESQFGSKARPTIRWSSRSICLPPNLARWLVSNLNHFKPKQSIACDLRPKFPPDFGDQSTRKLYDRVARQLFEDEALATRLAAALEKQRTELNFGDAAKSVAAFIRFNFQLGETRFHKFVFGQQSRTEQEVEGGLIFYGKGGCVLCHKGPYFSV